MITYRDIPHHFSFEDVYSLMVDEAKDNAVFVEIGTWFGASAAFLAQKIKDSGKAVTVYAVDNFTAEGAGPVLLARAAEVGGNFYNVFCANMRECGVAEYVKPIIGDSTETAAQFEDGSVDFAYIDACHQYAKVKADILAWLPKIKRGGVLAGHDFDRAHGGVVKAVREIFRQKSVQVMTHSWVVRVDGDVRRPPHPGR